MGLGKSPVSTSSAMKPPANTAKGAFDGAPYRTDCFVSLLLFRKLKDLKSKDIALTVTGKDLAALTEQINEAMKGINTTFVFATLVIYMIMVFLLSKLVIEKNTTNISMTKVLGFHPKEINRLFNRNSDFIKFWE